MAGRKNKYTVDYFPHYCKGNESKTIFILENKFGLKGYAIWFKTLELLGKSEYHYIDLREETDLLFLISKMRITEQELNDIYDLLSKLKAIDEFLWNHKIVFSENFINNIEDAYVRRKGINVLHKLDICNHLSIKCKHKSIKERKEDENKEDEKKKKKVYPDFFNEKLILIYNEFLQFRKEKKKTITKTQEPRFLEKLTKLSNKNPDIAKKILIQSIEQGWQGIFELKADSVSIRKKTIYDIDKLDYESDDPKRLIL